MERTRAGCGITLLRRRTALSSWRKWGSRAGGAKSRGISREGAVHARGADALESYGKSVGLPGRREWRTLHSRPRHALVLRREGKISHPAETKCPCPTLRLNRDKLGDGSSPYSLSRADIRRLISGAASFPTLFSTASGVLIRPRSRALQPP